MMFQFVNKAVIESLLASCTCTAWPFIVKSSNSNRFWKAFAASEVKKVIKHWFFNLGDFEIEMDII